MPESAGDVEDELEKLDRAEVEEDDKELPVWQVILRDCDPEEGDSCQPGTKGLPEYDYLSEMAAALEEPVVLQDLFDSTPDYLLWALGEPLPKSVEIGFEDLMTRAHTGMGYMAGLNETIVNTYHVETGFQTSVITKNFDDLTPMEMKIHQKEVDAAKLKEIKDLFGLGCFRRMPKKLAQNGVDTRWVIKWKMVEGMKAIKARLTMRGFKDCAEMLETFAGTASRWAQRVVNSIVAQNDDFALFSFDVGAAFAKGMTFKELSELTGQPLREVQFDLTAEDVKLLRLIPEFKDFDPQRETLSMVKPIYGLKDAPRAWRKKLHMVLTEWKLNQLYADEQIYYSHGEGGKLNCILSTHVDDLKGGAPKETAMRLLKHLEESVGKCKQEWDSFIHTGIEHVRDKDGVYTHQTTYAKQLNQMDPHLWDGKPDEEEVDEKIASLYLSLLGGVAWMVLTRVDMAVYVQALQRRAQKPRVKDCKNLNLVVRYLKKQKLGIRYRKLQGPLRLVAHSDAAFKALVGEGSGLALRGCCILLISDDNQDAPCSRDGTCHMIDFHVRRQRRVVRSTFSAELNGLIDSLEGLLLIQIAFHQLGAGTLLSADTMAKLLEEGSLTPSASLGTDARSVFDALAAQDVGDPAECSLKLHLLSIRDRLANGTIKILYWFDTRDMVADGLTKGGVDRKLIVGVTEQGFYKPQYEWTKHGRQSVRESALDPKSGKGEEDIEPDGMR